jgi:hypothetical protein
MKSEPAFQEEAEPGENAAVEEPVRQDERKSSNAS